MISRRSFLKTLGVGAAALTTGFAAGKIISSSKEERYSVHAFIPADDKIVNEILNSFSRKFDVSSVLIFAPAEMKRSIQKSFPAKNNSSGSPLVIRMEKINHPADSDILLSDQKNVVYNPAEDFNLTFSSIREKIKGKKAGYFLTAEYKSTNLFSSLLFSSDRTLIIENEKGIVDKILMKNSFKNIEVAGSRGVTSVKVENGLASVVKSSCRNKLCKLHGSISENGNLIACAPNKVILRIEQS